MKRFLILLLVTVLVLANLSYNSMGQALDLQSGEFEDTKFNGKEYLDSVAAKALLKCSSINVTAPGYEDDIESDDTIFDLLVSSGSVKSIEDVKRAGSVDIGYVDKYGVVLGSLHITGIVYFSSRPPVYEKDTKIFVWNCALDSVSNVVFDCCAHAHIGGKWGERWDYQVTNNYTLTVKEAGTVIAEGTMDSKISGTEASIFILLEGHDHKYQASLGDVEVTNNGEIGHIEVSDSDLGDSEVKLIADSFKSHYTAEEVTGVLWEEFHACLFSLISVRIVVYKFQDMNHTSLLSEMTSPITLIKSEDICRPELTPLQPLDPHSICSLIPQSMTVAWDDDYYAPHDKTTSQHSMVEEDSSQNGWGSTPSPRYSSNHGADADVLSENSCSTSTVISTPVKHTDSLPEWDDSVCPVRFIQREHLGWSSQAEKDPLELTQARKDYSYSPHFLDRPEQEYIILAGDELRCEVRRDGKSKGDDWLILEKISQQKSYFVEQSSILIGERSSDFIIRNSCFEPSSDFGADTAAFVEDRPYKCNVCSSSFKKKQYLKVHSIIHTGERPFQCPHCDKSFRQKTHLNNHVSIHTGIKPFKCRLCELSFRQKQHLKKHESSSHNLEM
uniref:C2H2-type domain-containing protein n=1 Tax=Timema cristinae TaxID=61476 RepID=A0A7R9CE45_TIMCR|nr:unnamed protein product [Timema cristinae]